MNQNAGGGMRLAPNQPPAGFSVSSPTMVSDPKHHRLGLMKMKVGTTHMLRDRQTGKRQQLTVRDAAQYPTKGLHLVCLHPSCVAAGKTWKTLDELVADHPAHKIMVEGGERHVVGWYSGAALEDDDAIAHVEKLVERAEAFLKLARKSADDAKDAEQLSAALTRVELAEKNVEGLRKMVSEKKAEIVGFVSDERLEG